MENKNYTKQKVTEKLFMLKLKQEAIETYLALCIEELWPTSTIQHFLKMRQENNNRIEHYEGALDNIREDKMLYVYLKYSHYGKEGKMVDYRVINDVFKFKDEEELFNFIREESKNQHFDIQHLAQIKK